MTIIELPDDQAAALTAKAAALTAKAAALTAKAAAEGMVLKDWLKKLAVMETDRPDESSLDERPISEVIAEIMRDVSPEELAQLPQDGASQIDHYVYGLPKRHW